jgi:hypothetical protein
MARVNVPAGGVAMELGNRIVYIDSSNLTRSPRHMCANTACITRTDGAAQLAAHYARCGRSALLDSLSWKQVPFS